jgi:hypothetical protein
MCGSHELRSPMLAWAYEVHILHLSSVNAHVQ